LAASLKQAGLELDVDIANGQIGPWLSEIANQRIHGTTGEKPQDLLDKERWSLQALPVRTETEVLALVKQPCVATPVESLQHPLAVYDELLEVRL
jgi:hypothetical protein